MGQVLQLPSLAAAVGASLELVENTVGSSPMRQVVDGSGRFSFTGLLVAKQFNYQVKVGGERVYSGSVSTGAAGSQQQLTI